MEDSVASFAVVDCFFEVGVVLRLRQLVVLAELQVALLEVDQVRLRDVLAVVFAEDFLQLVAFEVRDLLVAAFDFDHHFERSQVSELRETVFCVLLLFHALHLFVQEVDHLLRWSYVVVHLDGSVELFERDGRSAELVVAPADSMV